MLNAHYKPKTFQVFQSIRQLNTIAAKEFLPLAHSKTKGYASCTATATLGTKAAALSACRSGSHDEADSKIKLK